MPRSDENIRDFVDGAPKWRPSAKGSAPLPYLLFRDAQPSLSSVWLIKSVLPRHGLAVIYGPSGSGKTFVALDLLLHVARGIAWRGNKSVKVGVLYLAPDGGSIVANRIAAYRKYHNITDADFVLVPSPIDLLGKVNVGDLAKIDMLIAHINEQHNVSIQVIAVDTISRAMPGGDENQPADMTKFVENLTRLGNGTGRLVIGIHHTPKSDASVLRGHSSLHGAADCELNVSDRLIKVSKQRDGQDGMEFPFDLDVVEIGKDADGDVVTSCVAVPAESGGKRHRKLSDRDKLALDALRDLIIAEGEELPKGTRYPTAGQHLGVELSRWRDTLYEKAFSGTERDTFKKAFQRIRERLQAIGVIGVFGDLVWLGDTGT